MAGLGWIIPVVPDPAAWPGAAAQDERSAEYCEDDQHTKLHVADSPPRHELNSKPTPVPRLGRRGHTRPGFEATCRPLKPAGLNKPRHFLVFPAIVAYKPLRSRPPHPWRLAATTMGRALAAIFVQENKGLDKWRRPSMN